MVTDEVLGIDWEEFKENFDEVAHRVNRLYDIIKVIEALTGQRNRLIDEVRDKDDEIKELKKTIEKNNELLDCAAKTIEKQNGIINSLSPDSNVLEMLEDQTVGRYRRKRENIEKDLQEAKDKVKELEDELSAYKKAASFGL